MCACHVALLAWAGPAHAPGRLPRTPVRAPPALRRQGHPPRYDNAHTRTCTLAQGWLAELLMACEGELDALDAPAYALLVRALGECQH